MIIDIHVHVRPGATEEDHARLRRALQHGGADSVLISSVGSFEHYPVPDAVRQANASSESFVTRAPGFSQWLAYLNPQNDNWQEELQLCLARGAIGIKLWVAHKDAAGSLARSADVIALAQDADLPVLCHTFSSTDGNTPGEIDIVEFASLAERFPHARLVAAHAGGNWLHTPGTLAGAPNVCVDICGSFPARGMVETLVEDLGPERVLFGTDMPGRSFPSQLAKVTLADVPDEAKACVLWKNAARVFKLTVTPSATTRDEETNDPVFELPDATKDQCCFCGLWPFFDSGCASPCSLDAELATVGVKKAYVADLGCLWRQDLPSANREFVKSCVGYERMGPLAVVNPRAANWLHVLDDLPEGSAGVLVSPYLHSWRLDDPAHAALFIECARRAIPVWINCALGDHRFRHTALAWRPVAADEVTAFLRDAPFNAYVFQGLGGDQILPAADLILGRDDVQIEIARLTDLHGRLASVREAGLGAHLVMGSEFPFRDMREVMWTARRLPPAE